MDSLGASFTIEVDGTPVAKIGSADEDCAQATLGPDAAVCRYESPQPGIDTPPLTPFSHVQSR